MKGTGQLNLTHITKSKHLIILGSVYRCHVHLHGHNTCVSHITTMSESRVAGKKELVHFAKKKRKKESIISGMNTVKS